MYICSRIIFGLVHSKRFQWNCYFGRIGILVLLLWTMETQGVIMRTPDGKPFKLPGWDSPFELHHPCENRFSSSPFPCPEDWKKKQAMEEELQRQDRRREKEETERKKKQ